MPFSALKLQDKGYNHRIVAQPSLLSVQYICPLQTNWLFGCDPGELIGCAAVAINPVRPINVSPLQ